MSAVDDLKASVTKLVSSVKTQEGVINGMQSATQVAQNALAEEKAAHAVTSAQLAETLQAVEALKVQVDAAVTAA